MKKMGRLVAFEGIDRAGKSTVVNNLSNDPSMSSFTMTVCGELQSPISAFVRELLAKGGSPFLKTFFFASDRAWEYEKRCLPAIERGDLVLWDRYVDSALVYRSIELPDPDSLIDMDFVRIINSPFMRPDLTIYIDISVETSLLRSKYSGEVNPYSHDFLDKVRHCYLNSIPSDTYCVVDGEQSIEDVTEEVGKIIINRFRDILR